jgi:hypothetical protein
MESFKVPYWRARRWSLGHICQRWRYLILASPVRLNLYLFCRDNTPVKNALDVWPPLPIEIQSESGDFGDNIIAALEHSNRVREILLCRIRSPLESLVTVTQEPFPALESLHLGIDWDVCETAPALPDTFLGGYAPRLRSLRLHRIPFPTVPKLLLSSPDLSYLVLSHTPHSGYISPEVMVACVAAFPRFAFLEIGFESPASRPDQGAQRPPPLTRAVLPALTKFEFRGVSEYLEDLVARIFAPLLDDVKILLFNRLIFDIQRLAQFISHALVPVPYDSAEITFHSHTVMIRLSSMRRPYTKFFQLTISCKGGDWQVSSMAQICNQFSFLLPGIAKLDILERSGSFDMDDDTQWLELLLPFTAVLALFSSLNCQSRIVSALQGLSEESVTEVLPSLKVLTLEVSSPPQAASESELKPFLTARRRYSCPFMVQYCQWRPQ